MTDGALKKDQTDGFYYREGIVRTDVTCTDCGKTFIAKINHDLDGNHHILCPYCGHEHWRAVRKGVVTDDRWGSQHGANREVPTERLWSDTTPVEGKRIETNTAAEFIRQRWLSRREREEGDT